MLVQDIINWIETNSTTAGFIFKAICGIIGLIIAGLLYYFKFYRKQRMAALFGFYTRLHMLLSILESQTVGCSEDSNPYVLLYKTNARDRYGLVLPGGNEESIYLKFEPISKEIKELFLNTEQNVYPKSSRRKSWYNSQLVILDFALMITDKLGANTLSPIDKATVHKEKWNDLQNAIKAIKCALKDVKQINPKGRNMQMNLMYLMDTMFDLINESENLNVQELIEEEQEGKFYITTGDGTKVLVQCNILSSESAPE